jgi:hypothetical protein
MVQEELAGHLSVPLAFRQANPQRGSQIKDCMYQDLFRDPIGTVKNLYSRFGLDYSQEFEDGMRTYVENNKQGKYGREIFLDLRIWVFANAMISALIATVGMFLLGSFGDVTVLALLALAMVASGGVSWLTIYWSFPTSFLTGAAAAGGIALMINSIASLGGWKSTSASGGKTASVLRADRRYVDQRIRRDHAVGRERGIRSTERTATFRNVRI